MQEELLPTAMDVFVGTFLKEITVKEPISGDCTSGRQMNELMYESDDVIGFIKRNTLVSLSFSVVSHSLSLSPPLLLPSPCLSPSLPLSRSLSSVSRITSGNIAGSRALLPASCIVNSLRAHHAHYPRDVLTATAVGSLILVH